MWSDPTSQCIQSSSSLLHWQLVLPLETVQDGPTVLCLCYDTFYYTDNVITWSYPLSWTATEELAPSLVPAALGQTVAYPRRRALLYGRASSSNEHYTCINRWRKEWIKHYSKHLFIVSILDSYNSQHIISTALPLRFGKSNRSKQG
jgi:hypothetical protein